MDQESLEIMVVRLNAATAKQPAIGPYPLAVSPGVALLVPGEPHSLADLLAQADERMYENRRARKRGRV